MIRLVADAILALATQAGWLTGSQQIRPTDTVLVLDFCMKEGRTTCLTC